MKVTYDKQADALYIALAQGRVKKTVKVSPRVLVDIGGKGQAIGIELLFVSQRVPKSELQSFPRSLAAATR